MLSGLLDKDSRASQHDTELDRLVLSLSDKYAIHAIGYALIDAYKVAQVKTISDSIVRDASSLFQACSLSKSITAYAVLDLVAQNKIQLDSPINMYLDSWKINGSPYNNIVTVRHCLNMTSGLCFGDSGTIFAGYSCEASLPALSEILRGKTPATNPPVKMIFEPGTQYHYSGASYTVLQQLIEDIVKQKFEIYMNDIILPRLGMHNSIYECPLSHDKHARVMSGYKQDGMQIEGGWNNIVGAASGGLWSCPIDIANFMLFVTKLYAGKSAVFQEMLSAHANTDYGLGFVIDGSNDSLNFRKNGHNAGYHNELIMFPNCGKGIVIMTNSALGISLINELVAFVSQKFSWPKYRSDFNELVNQPMKK